MSDRRFFSGDSIAQAVNQAAQHFKLMPDEIAYKTVEKRHGFLKVRRKVVIEVSESSPRKADAPPRESAEPREAATGPSAESAEPVAETTTSSGGWSWTTVSSPEPVSSEPVRGQRVEPSADGPPSDEVDTEEQPEAAPVPREAPSRTDEPAELFDDQPDSEPLSEPVGERDSAPFELSEAPQPASKRYPPAVGEEAEAAAEALQKVLALASLDLESEILQGDEQLEIELWGPGQKILLRDRGRLLLAIQHLLPRVIRGLIGRSVSCRVDSDNFHEIREERLRDLAQRAADDVHHRGRTKTLEPMSPDERRIVHLTLSDYPGVETESQGSGLFKRVMVRKIRQGRERRPHGYDR